MENDRQNKDLRKTTAYHSMIRQIILLQYRVNEMQWKDTSNFLDLLKTHHEEDRESN